jgi:hypothetical protein
MQKTKNNSTAVLTDIRNFTSLFEKYQDIDNHKCNDLINKYYDAHLDVADIIGQEDSKLSSTGDGVLSLFKGAHHYKNAYAFSLVIYKILNEIFTDFNKSQKRSSPIKA